MPKLYLSVFNDGQHDLHIKDAEARQSIADIQSAITGAMHYIGVSTTKIEDGDGAAKGPWTIDGVEYIASGTPTSGQKLLSSGDVAIYGELEFVWSATASKWKEFGSTGSLKSLAFKDASDIETGGSTSKKLATTSITGTNGTETVSKVTKSEKKLGKTSVGSASGWSDGDLPSMTYDANTEKLTFTAGSKPALTITPTGVATGSLVSTDTEGAGDKLVDGVTIDDKNVAKVADSATTVATGNVADSDDHGASVITGVSTTIQNKA